MIHRVRTTLSFIVFCQLRPPCLSVYYRHCECCVTYNSLCCICGGCGVISLYYEPAILVVAFWLVTGLVRVSKRFGDFESVLLLTMNFVITLSK